MCNDIRITQIDRPVAFLREGDAIFSDDHWNAVINYDVSIYDSVVSTLGENLAAKEMADQSTSNGELRQVEAALNTLREKVTGIKRFLPRSIRKRGLFNIGGTILKHLFGTVTVLDLNALHATVEELHQRQDAVTHSLDRHLTYIKQLDQSVRLDQQAIHNLSSNIRDFARKTQETFQEVATKLEWSNKLRASATLIRQLEFSLARLESRLDETLTALQFVVNGKISVNLISPAVLRDILVNVSLSLPEGYELAARLPDNDLSSYYMYVSANGLVSPRGFLLVLSIPLKDVTSLFEIFKIFMFPSEVFNGTYVQFQFEEQYLALSIAQQTHLALNENDLRQCRGRPEYKICPAAKAVLNNEITTCALSLYLQMDNMHSVCECRVYMTPPAPNLIRHGAAVVFHSPEPHQAFFRCKRGIK
jgi:hypothetical protein